MVRHFPYTAIFYGLNSLASAVNGDFNQGLKHGEFRLRSKERFSTVYCRKLSEPPLCLFSNVAVTGDTLVFYENPDEPLIFITSRIRMEFPQQFIRHRGGASSGSKLMNVLKQKGPIPDTAFYVPQDLTVLLSPHWPENLGHFLVEDLFASFAVLYDLGLVRKKWHLTLMDSCQSMYHSGPMLKSCLKSYTERVKGASPDDLPLYLNHKHPYNPLSKEANVSETANSFSAGGTGVFFQNIAVGTHLFDFRANRQFRSVPWQLFRSFYLQNLGIPLKEPTAPLITIMVKKSGHRHVVNIQEVIDCARGLGVRVQTLEPPEQTWAEEVTILTQSTVFFTVPGGASMGASFLHPKSVAMIVDLWETKTNIPYSSSFESHWWEMLGAFYGMDYMLDEDEIVHHPGLNNESLLSKAERAGVSSQKVPSDARAYIIRLYSNYRINIPKLKRYFCQALLVTEKTYGWLNSFDRSKC